MLRVHTTVAYQTSPVCSRADYQQIDKFSAIFESTVKSSEGSQRHFTQENRTFLPLILNTQTRTNFEKLMRYSYSHLKIAQENMFPFQKICVCVKIQFSQFHIYFTASIYMHGMHCAVQFCICIALALLDLEFEL